jgi:hypothetical protein
VSFDRSAYRQGSIAVSSIVFELVANNTVHQSITLPASQAVVPTKSTKSTTTNNNNNDDDDDNNNNDNEDDDEADAAVEQRLPLRLVVDLQQLRNWFTASRCNRRRRLLDRRRGRVAAAARAETSAALTGGAGLDARRTPPRATTLARSIRSTPTPRRAPSSLIGREQLDHRRHALDAAANAPLVGAEKLVDKLGLEMDTHARGARCHDRDGGQSDVCCSTVSRASCRAGEEARSHVVYGGAVALLAAHARQVGHARVGALDFTARRFECRPRQQHAFEAAEVD